MTDACNCGCPCCDGGASQNKATEEQIATLEKEKQEKQDIDRRLAELQRA